MLNSFGMRPSNLLAFAISVLVSIASAAQAGPLSHLSGRVLDSKRGTPVENATVLVAGKAGVQRTILTDARGHYATDVAPGSYVLVFIYGTARSSGHVDLVAGTPKRLDGRVDSTEGEVIEIRERFRPPVPAKATNFNRRKAPPYSDRAVLSNAWTRAWFLLDIDARGNITRMKWLKRPGYDLEDIAVNQVKKLTFDPARNSKGQAIRSYIVWGVEWPSAWWLQQIHGTRAGMPHEVWGWPPRREDDYVPCKDAGKPLHMGSFAKAYKDCSKPDLSVAARERWFRP